MWGYVWIPAALIVSLPIVALWLINRRHESNLAEIYRKHQEALTAIYEQHRERMDAILGRYKA